ncbi:MAG: DUF2938 domain-containing protein [Loktanella sp.]|nr:DUF2938 domain-containing protein [Loktanella sp.]
MTFIVHAIFVGVIATSFMDFVALAQKRFMGVPSLNYAMVGRWIGHIRKGRIIHRPIGQSPPIPHEAMLGWAVHYLIGVVFAAIFLLLSRPEWAQSPGLVWPVIFGVATVAAPFLVLQPGMGAGFAARKTPKPWIARLRSVSAHVAFGIGLWLGAVLWVAIGGS